MQAYEHSQSSYFLPPSLQIVYDLHSSMTAILDEPFDTRFNRQRQVASDFRQAIKNWGLQLVPRDEACTANGYTSIWLPSGLDIVKLVEGIARKGAQVNIGSLKSSNPYFRVR